RRHTRLQGDWSSDVCSSDLLAKRLPLAGGERRSDQVETVELRAERHDIRTSERSLDLSMLQAGGYGPIPLPRTFRSLAMPRQERSEERRVGKECTLRRWLDA